MVGARQEATRRTRREEIRETGRHVLARLPRVVSCPWIKAKSKHTQGPSESAATRGGDRLQEPGSLRSSPNAKSRTTPSAALLALASINRLLTTGPDSRSPRFWGAPAPSRPPAADTQRRGPAGTYTRSENYPLPRHCGCGVLCPSETEWVCSRSYCDGGGPGPGPRLLVSVRRPPRPPPGPCGSQRLAER